VAACERRNAGASLETEDLRSLYSGTANAVLLFCGQPCNLSNTQYVFCFLYSEIMAANCKTHGLAICLPWVRLEVIS
jgi:hypothetical protein